MATPTNNFPLLDSLKQGLGFSTVDELKRLIQILPIKKAPTRKAELVDAIAQHLLGTGLKAQWNQLDSLQQAAVAETAYNSPDGRFQPEIFQAKYKDLPDWPNRSYYRYGEPATPLDLFFYRIGTYGSRDILPDELAQKLKSFVPQPEPLRLTTCDSLPDAVENITERYDFRSNETIITRSSTPLRHRPMEQTALQDLSTILRLIQMGKVSVSEKTLMPSKATLKGLTLSLHDGDYYSEADDPDSEYSSPIGSIRAFAWVMLVQAGKLASPSGKKLQLTKAGQKALSADPAKTLRTLWQRWQKSKILDELRRIDNIKGQTGKGKRGLTAPSGRRSHIVEALEQCPVEPCSTGQWVELDSFMRVILVNQGTFLVSRHPQNLHLFESAGYGSPAEDEGCWGILQDSYLRCFLFEYAATLGLLDLGYVPPQDAPRNNRNYYWGLDHVSFFSRYDGLAYLRVTALGAFCLGLVEEYSPPKVVSKTQIKIQPNGTITNAGPPLSALETGLLNHFAKINSNGSWRLDRRKALEAIVNGQSLDQFDEFLSQSCAGEFPVAATEFFEDCRRRSESLQDQGVARLVKCASAELAQQIATDPHLKKCCRLVGDRELVIPKKQETKFIKALQKMGYSLNLLD